MAASEIKSRNGGLNEVDGILLQTVVEGTASASSVERQESLPLRRKVRNISTVATVIFFVLLLGGAVLGFVDVDTLERYQPLLNALVQTVDKNCSLETS